MKSLAPLLLLIVGAGCASQASRPLAVPPSRTALAANGHDHECVAAAEAAWATREKEFERKEQSENALAIPREPQERPAADLEPFDEAAAERAQADMALTARIRRALLDDASLSFSAQNVKVLTKDGKVTLRGVVKDARERIAVEDIAEGVAGDGNVENRL